MSDTIEAAVQVLQKPNAIDSPIYEKPNAYDDDDFRIFQSTPSRLDVEGDMLPSEIGMVPESMGDSSGCGSPTYFWKPDHVLPSQNGSTLVGHRESVISTTSTSTSTTVTITSSLLSPSTPTTHTISDALTVSLTSLAMQRTYTPSLANPSPTTSSSSRDSTSKQLLINSLSRKRSKSKRDTVIFELRKYAHGSQPHTHDIFWNGTKTLAYRKVLDHSYSWGFRNVLYRHGVEDASADGVKVAEARRPAFQKDIILEWGDFGGGQERSRARLSHKSSFHFTSETTYEDFKIRWKRPSLLSRDLVCDILVHQMHHKAIETEDEEEEQDTPNEEMMWKTIAHFDSHRLGLGLLGRLAIDRHVLLAMDRSDQFEAHLIMTCCTLVDQMMWLGGDG